MKNALHRTLLLGQRGVPLVRHLALPLIALVMCLTIAGGMPALKAHAAVPAAIIPGGAWTDNNGNSVQAHGAGIIKVGDTYYWFGEWRGNNNFYFQDISCYSSTDLLHWTFQNFVLQQQSTGDLGPNRVVERPKVVYNSSTSTYVMYLHIDSSNYSEGKVGVATSSTVCGNYTYQGSYNPLGNQSRDMSVFEDTDGSAYLLYATNNNTDLKIDKLSSDYLSDTGTVQTFSGVYWEAPGMFKVGSRYFLIVSSPTGWAPNPNKYVTSTSLSKGWSSSASLAPNSPNTYDSQDAFILPVVGSSGTTYIYMGDRWDSKALGNSRYIWLPLTINNNQISLPSFYDAWTINVSTGTWSAVATTSYEGESSANTLTGTAVVQNCTYCSGGKAVGYLGNNTGTLTINNVSVPSSDYYLLTIYYANGDSTARTATISIDGGAGTTYSFASSHSSNDPATLPVTVYLTAGSNTIEFYNTSTWAPDIDKITIAG